MRNIVVIAVVVAVATPVGILLARRPTAEPRQRGVAHPRAAGGIGIPIPPDGVRGIARDARTLLALHDAGVRRDPAGAQQALEALKNPSDHVCKAGLWVLSRLESADHLAAVRAVASRERRYDPFSMREEALAAAARIEAAAGGPPADLAQLGTRMRAVVARAGLSPSQAAAALRAGQEADPHAFALARAVARQLADMALAARDRGMRDPAAALPFDVSLVPGAKAKVEMSAYPPEERARILVETLAGKRVQRGEDDPLIQLLTDEGPSARPAILAAPAALAQDPPGTHTSAAFGGLLDALAGIGGTPEAVALVEKLCDHPDKYVASQARIARTRLEPGGRAMYEFPF